MTLISAKERAAALLNDFLAGEFAKVIAAGDSGFRAAAKAEDLASLRSALGALREMREWVAETRDDLVRFETRADFASGVFSVRIVLRGEELAGFFVVPIQRFPAADGSTT